MSLMKNKEVKKSVFREDRMNKIVILYASVHHNNTRKLVNHIASGIQADVIDILKTKNWILITMRSSYWLQEFILILSINLCWSI